MDAIKKIIQDIEKLKGEKKYDESISLAETALTRYNTDYRLYEELADIYLFLGKLEKATKAVNFALELNSDSATGNYLKGFICLSRNKAKDAISYLEKSNSLMLNNAEVLRNLGWAYNMVGETTRGISILKRALNISPNDPLITEDLAMALIGIGEITEGNALLEKIGYSNKIKNKR
ncbi:MAG: tetratricopeptide repeat protein [Candidatus Gracilibacteria bacterium]|nr:tetratricopeptide repeat protein [Candidatus Gracilibacteria bacterium]